MQLNIIMALIKCNSCGQMISDQAKNCPKCGAYVSSPSVVSQKFKMQWGWFVIALIVPPILGVIYYFIDKGKNPNRAKSVLYGALISFVIYMCLF